MGARRGRPARASRSGVAAALALALAVAGAIALCACGSGPTSAPTTRPVTPTTQARATSGAGAYRHVVVVMMENLSYDEALATPGFAALAHRYAYASDSFAVSHPSLPNYLAISAGSTFGIASDCLDCFVAADNVAAQLSEAGRSWADYVEDVDAPCYLGISYGTYAAKHNPFRYFDDVRASARRCAHLVPITDLYAALRGPASALPAFSFVVPNVCHDGHDCPARTAAAWLTSLVARITGSAAWRDHGLVIVTWDEAEGDDRALSPSGRVAPSGGGGHVLTLYVAAGWPHGVVVRTPTSDYSLLATIEHNFSLPYLRRAASWRSRVLLAP